MIGVFYPYLQGAGAWEELRYSLRSLEKHLDAEFEVWIVGDRPDWITNVNYISHTKTEGIAAPSTYDAVSKLQAYIDREESPELFIRMYDDIYFLRDCTQQDLSVTRYLFTYEQMKAGALKSGSRLWQNQVHNSVYHVHKKGFSGMMTETHCPEVFEKGKMRQVIEQFDPGANRLLTSTLYFNMFPFETCLLDHKRQRALFYGTDNEFSYHSSCLESGDWLEGKYFLNHNDQGLDQCLKNFIQSRFTKKSRFEKIAVLCPLIL